MVDIVFGEFMSFEGLIRHSLLLISENHCYNFPTAFLLLELHYEILTFVS